jgi:signal recognition particle GTPase
MLEYAKNYAKYAIKYAKNHKIDIVLIDTAGRMHTKSNLLQEMEKIFKD